MYSMLKKNISLVIFFSFLVFIIPFVSATITITVSAPSSVTQGSNVPITASFVAGEGDSGTFYFTCDQTVSGEVDPESGYSIMSSTSKTYTFTPGTAQSYSNCKVSDGGTQSSSSFPINVVTPSTLTVSGSPSSTTNSSGDTFPLSISITNPTASSITTSYSLNCPSGYTCSGDQSSDTITILAGLTTTLQWTVTVGSSSADITFQLGSNSNAFISSVTVPSITTTTVGGGTGGSGGAGGGISITAYSLKQVEINKTNVALTQLDIIVNDQIKLPKLTVNNISTRPASVTLISGKVYQYLNITPQNIEDNDLQSVKLKFRVEKAWIADNNIDENTVSLNRYHNGVWNRLTTDKVSEDSIYLYYQTETPGFSVFAVTGEQKFAPAEERVITTTTVRRAVVTTTTVASAPKLRLPRIEFTLEILLTCILGILVVMTLGLVFLKLRKDNLEKEQEEVKADNETVEEKK